MTSWSPLFLCDAPAVDPVLALRRARRLSLRQESGLEHGVWRRKLGRDPLRCPELLRERAEEPVL